MNKKKRLNTMMNIYITLTDFWLWVAERSGKAATYATARVRKCVEANVGIAEEMLKEDYLTSFKTQLTQLENTKGKTGST